MKQGGIAVRIRLSQARRALGMAQRHLGSQDMGCETSVKGMLRRHLHAAARADVGWKATLILQQGAHLARGRLGLGVAPAVPQGRTS